MKYTIEQARILSGFTQVEMAERLSMTEKTYIQYEKYRRIFRMDQAFTFIMNSKVSMEDVIFFEGQLQKNCSSEEKEGVK